jgi:DNA-binding IclR family transcriptional regulator
MSAAKTKKRLRPGELDGLVLSYMRKHRGDAPLTATAIGRGLERSAGAVANCLTRLTEAGKVRQAKKRPRAYALKEAKSK